MLGVRETEMIRDVVHDTLMGCSLSLVSNGRRVTKQNEDRLASPSENSDGTEGIY